MVDLDQFKFIFGTYTIISLFSLTYRLIMHYTTIGYLRVGPKTDDIKKFVVLRIVISREGRQLEGTLARFSGPWIWLNILQYQSIIFGD